MSNLLLAPSPLARTPAAVRFAGGPTTFILVTLHVRYGSSPADRIGGLTAVAQWLADWGTLSMPRGA